MTPAELEALTRRPEPGPHRALIAGDGREVVDVPGGPYFGIPVDDRSLVPGEGARIGATRFEDWLHRVAAPARAQPVA